MFKKQPRCRVCDQKPPNTEPAILRLKTQDGVHEILVCDECAEFFDKSTEILLKRKTGDA